MKKFSTYFFSILSVVILYACNNNVVFEKNVDIPDYRWQISAPLKFEVNVEDTLSKNNFYINLRHASGYAFSNIFLFLKTTTPSGKLASDTIEITLAEKNGKWTGDGSGDIWDTRTLFKPDFVFPESGQYTFELQQAMRVDPLPQVMDAGIRIEKVKN